jgi:hypothetical protein
MHLFGLLGTLMFFVGFFAAAYLGINKLITVWHGSSARMLTERPSFYISLTCMIIGSMLFLAGFLGELIARNSHDRNKYQVDKRIN